MVDYRGTGDDTAGLQAAIDAAAGAGETLTLAGRIRISQPLTIPALGMSLTAATYDPRAFTPVAQGQCVVESTAPAVFQTPAGGTNGPVHIDGVSFRRVGGPSDGALFRGVTLTSAILHRLYATNFGTVFDASPMTLTRITDGHFLHIGGAFTNGSVIDSFIRGNYINGNPAANATCFRQDAALATTTISGNYIDFFKRVVDVRWAGNLSDVRLIDNTFDFCWNVIGSSNGSVIHSLNVQGNSFRYIRAAEAFRFPNADDEMRAGPWVAINALRRTIIAGNRFLWVDLATRVRGAPVSALRISGNEYGNAVGQRIDYAADYWGGATEGRDIRVEEMDGQRFDVLPSASLTKSPVRTFDQMTAYHQGFPVWNDAGTWRRTDGTAVPNP